MQILLVLAILVLAIVLFVSERLRVDVVAMIVLALLLVTRLISPAEGASGFSSPATLTVAAMFVLSEGLRKTGAMQWVGRLLIQFGNNSTLLLLTIIALAAVVSAFVNNTAAVAVLLPVILALCVKKNLSASRLLIPLSFASQFGGVCTLIGSSTNLLVNDIATRSGMTTFTMFEFSRFGFILIIAGTLYLLFVGRFLLPSRRSAELVDNFRLGEYITELRVLEDSPLIGKTVIEAGLAKKQDLTVLEISRDGKTLWAPLSEKIHLHDILLVRATAKNLINSQSGQGLEIDPMFRVADKSLRSADHALVEAMVAPRAALIGKSLTELNFRGRYKAIVLAIQRRERILRSRLSDVRLQFGDSLLLQVSRDQLNALRSEEEFIILDEVENTVISRRKSPIALATIIAVVALAALNILPIMASAIAGCVVLIVTGCLKIEDAYHAIDWKVIFLLAGILPLGIAMENSGTAEMLAHGMLNLTGGYGPIVVLACFYLCTAVMTEFMSNNAAAVLLAPIAISTGLDMGIDPKPLVMAVTFAASTSFATPVGYQTNTMVYSPGGYKFTDFLKIGVPLNLLFWVLAVIFIPKFWPF